MDSTCAHCHGAFRVRNRGQKFCSLRCANTANRNNSNPVILPAKRSVELAELFGILLGDGSVEKYYTKVYLNLSLENEYAAFVRQLSEKLFSGATITVRKRPGRGTVEVQISSKSVSDYLISAGFNPKTRTVPLWISDKQDFSVASVRGLFDTEGTVGHKKYLGKGGAYLYKQLTFTNTKASLRSFVVTTLAKKGFHPTTSTRNNVYISNKLDITRYLSHIGTNNPKLLKKLTARSRGLFKYGWGA